MDDADGRNDDPSSMYTAMSESVRCRKQKHLDFACDPISTIPGIAQAKNYPKRSLLARWDRLNPNLVGCQFGKMPGTIRTHNTR